MSEPKPLRVTVPAQGDLGEIGRHIEQNSPAAAERFLRELADRMNWIAQTDFTGVPRDHLMAGLRGYPFKGRTIYYVSDDEAVRILRVLHDARNVTSDDFT